MSDTPRTDALVRAVKSYCEQNGMTYTEECEPDSPPSFVTLARELERSLAEEQQNLASMTERAEAHTLHIAELVTEKTRLRNGWDKATDYGIALQRLIESHCHGYAIPEECEANAPHHAAMVKAGCSYAEELEASLRLIRKHKNALFNVAAVGDDKPTIRDLVDDALAKGSALSIQFKEGAGSTPAQSQRPGGKGAGFESPEVARGAEGAAGTADKATAESVAGASDSLRRLVAGILKQSTFDHEGRLRTIYSALPYGWIKWAKDAGCDLHAHSDEDAPELNGVGNAPRIQTFEEWANELRAGEAVPSQCNSEYAVEPPSVREDAARYRFLIDTDHFDYTPPPLRAVRMGWLCRLTKEEADFVIDKMIAEKSGNVELPQSQGGTK